MTLQPFRFVDLFSGAGGFRMALDGLGGKCVLSCEIDERARATYERNFDCDGHEFPSDIHDVKELPPHDILVAGFPCQSFSTQRQPHNKKFQYKSGFEDEKTGGLFFEIVRLLKQGNTPSFVLENVKNLLSHDGGKTLREIVKQLTDIGYHVTIGLVNSRPWVPQARKRVFIVGYQGFRLGGFDFDDIPRPDPAEWPILASILDDDPPDSFTYSDKGWAGLRNHKKRMLEQGKTFGYRVYSPNDVFPTLLASYSGGTCGIIATPGDANPRRLTPREAARLMGFPDSFTLPEQITYAYRQMGNSVVVPCVQAICAHVLRYM